MAREKKSFWRTDNFYYKFLQYKKASINGRWLSKYETCLGNVRSSIQGTLRATKMNNKKTVIARQLGKIYQPVASS